MPVMLYIVWVAILRGMWGLTLTGMPGQGAGDAPEVFGGPKG